jgi:hypothetical protein
LETSPDDIVRRDCKQQREKKSRQREVKATVPFDGRPSGGGE